MWKKVEYPNHTFDQSRNNAVTPITHLFLESKILPIDTPPLNTANLLVHISGTHAVVNVTRTGRVVTLLNLSLYEPETVLRVFNEIFFQ